jgi:hypothetical protein
MPALSTLHAAEVSKAFSELISGASPPSLAAPIPCPSTTLKLDELVRTVRINKSAQAGLWLLAGDLDRSHSISQELHHADGSYWHGIMHRTEGDYWNAKYWMGRARGHAVRVSLVRRIRENVDCLAQSAQSDQLIDISPIVTKLNSSETVSESLIDLVEQAVTKQTEWSLALQTICWWEWEELFFQSLKH